MSHTNDLPVPDELAASLRRVVNDREAETLYDSEGAPVAVLSPIAEAAPQARAVEQFLAQLRAWRQGNPEQQQAEWEQLQEVLAVECGVEPRRGDTR
jgi:hypothetical protein